jgi:hypothetical protein
MTALYVAAGGGGDAIAAHAIARALHDDRAPAVASYSWDRFVLDPAPGPRRAEDFDGLTQHAAGCWEVTRTSRLRSGARSTLTIGAASTDGRWFLLDPYRGAIGVRQQLESVAEAIGADDLVAVDVGGDIVTHCDEPGLRSPLADSLTLAALIGANRTSTVAVAGPGLDGELPASVVEERCRSARATTISLTIEHFSAARQMLEVHPSEATTLLAAALDGARGTVEIRDSGTELRLTAQSAYAFLLPSPSAAAINPLARALVGSPSLDEASRTTHTLCGRSELDYERHKATDVAKDRPSAIDEAELTCRVKAYATDAVRRGTTLAPFRRIADAIGVRTYDPMMMRRVLGDATHPWLPLALLERCADRTAAR